MGSMTSAAERQQTVANLALADEVRKLATAGWYISQIAARLGCTRQRLCGLLAHHKIEVKRTPLKPRQTWVRKRDREPEPVPPPSDPWPSVLAGRRYEDDDRVAPPMAFQLPRRPPAALTANSSMAWAG